MGSVTIQGSAFDVFGTYAAAVTYFKAALHAAAWLAAAPVVRQQGMVTATRMILRARPVDPSSGAAIVPAAAPVPVEEACYELANALIADPTLQETLASGSNVRRTRSRDKVGEIETESEVENFRSTLGLAGRFPKIVQELLGPYLGGGAASVSAGGFVSGLDEASAFGDSEEFGLTIPGLP